MEASPMVLVYVFRFLYVFIYVRSSFANLVRCETFYQKKIFTLFFNNFRNETTKYIIIVIIVVEEIGVFFDCNMWSCIIENIAGCVV